MRCSKVTADWLHLSTDSLHTCTEEIKVKLKKYQRPGRSFMLTETNPLKCTWLKAMWLLLFKKNLEQNLCLDKNKHPELQLEPLHNNETLTGEPGLHSPYLYDRVKWFFPVVTTVQA